LLDWGASEYGSEGVRGAVDHGYDGIWHG